MGGTVPLRGYSKPAVWCLASPLEHEDWEKGYMWRWPAGLQGAGQTLCLRRIYSAMQPLSWRFTSEPCGSGAAGFQGGSALVTRHLHVFRCLPEVHTAQRVSSHGSGVALPPSGWEAEDSVRAWPPSTCRERGCRPPRHVGGGPAYTKSRGRTLFMQSKCQPKE